MTVTGPLKSIVVAFGLALCILSSDVGAQSWSWPSGSNSWYCSEGKGISIIPAARVGYEGYAFSFNLPAGDTALDLGLVRAGLPMGSVGLLVTSDRVGLFANAEGTLERTVSVRTAQDPFQVTWSGSRFQQGSLEAGMIYKLNMAQPNGVSLIGGVRWSKISSSLGGPVVASSGQGSFDLPGNLGTVTYATSNTSSYDGDINVPMWLPYLGVQLAGANYRASLIGSPFASVQLKIPFRSRGTEFGGITAGGDIPSNHPWPIPWVRWALDLQSSENEIGQVSYKFNRLGAFLEGNFEYDCYVTPRLTMNLWTRGQWFQFRGNGTAGWSFSEAGSNSFSTRGDLWAWRFLPWLNPRILTNLWNISGTVPFGSNSAGSNSGTGSLNIYTYALGVTASLAF